jgi:copper chaperone CopZ
MINKTELKDLLPKWWSIVFWICIGLVFFGNRLNGQTYSVGDTITFKVNGLVCSFCAHGLNKGIGKMDYTDENNVFVDIKKQTVKVVILKEPNIEETIKLITDSGYDVSKITYANEVIWKKEK